MSPPGNCPFNRIDLLMVDKTPEIIGADKVIIASVMFVANISYA
jgi:hypothetical protein